LSYAEQAVFWRPEFYAQTVLLAPCATGFPRAAVFQPDAWPGRCEVRDGPDGRHLLLRVGGDTHQVLAAPTLRCGVAMAVLTPAEGLAGIRLDAARRLLRALAGAAPRAPPRRLDHRLVRLRQALGAFDAWRAGRAYREIAVRLYGAGRVEAEPWRTSPLRDSVIRLTRLGRTLVGGGYRRLLARAPG
jgi:hypothetical protein